MHASPTLATLAPVASGRRSATSRPNPRPEPRPAPRAVAAPVGRRAVAPAPGAAPDAVRAHGPRRRLAVAAVAAAVGLSAVGIGFGVGHASADLEGPPPARPVYVVQPGDTLWTIAGRVAPGVDTARAVAALRDAAGGAALQPGQRIPLPRGLS